MGKVPNRMGKSVGPPVVHLAHNAAMPKRVYIALAVLLVILAGVIAWQGLRERKPVYHFGKELSGVHLKLLKELPPDSRAMVK